MIATGVRGYPWTLFAVWTTMQPIRRLITAFESRTKLPVEPEEVRQWIVANGFCDEIQIHYVDCDPKAFEGMYVARQGGEYQRRVSPYGEMITVREIFINANVDLPMRRLAEVKEQLHILDANGQCSNSPASIDAMIAFAATRVDLKPEAGVITDVLAMPLAMAVLFPIAAQRLLKPKYDAGLISLEEIASIAVLPPPLIELAMSDGWETVYKPLVITGDAMNGMHDCSHPLSVALEKVRGETAVVEPEVAHAEPAPAAEHE